MVMEREIQYKSVSYLNVPPPLVPRSGGDQQAAVQRSELTEVEVSFNNEVAKRLRFQDLNDLYATVDLDDSQGNVDRTSYTDSVGGVEYVMTVFQVYVDGWATEHIWEEAMFEQNKQVTPEHDFLVTAPGMCNLVFQSNSLIENGKYRIILQRLPFAAPAQISGEEN